MILDLHDRVRRPGASLRRSEQSHAYGDRRAGASYTRLRRRGLPQGSSRSTRARAAARSLGLSLEDAQVRRLPQAIRRVIPPLERLHRAAEGLRPSSVIGPVEAARQAADLASESFNFDYLGGAPPVPARDDPAGAAHRLA